MSLKRERGILGVKIKTLEKIKEKKEFSQLPDSLIERAVQIAKGDVKEARAILRKYFGVFLTNKLLSGKLSPEEILKKHLSTKNRDYGELYRKLIVGEKTVVDLGAGVNGFSYNFMPRNTVYVAIEATGQFVKMMNNYFRDRGYEKAHVFHRDLYDLGFIIKILKGLEEKKPRVVFMFNILDALEFFKRDYSKKLIAEVSENCEKLVLSFPTKSLSGKTTFKVSRGWLKGYIEENFGICEEFSLNGERFLIIKK